MKQKTIFRDKIEISYRPYFRKSPESYKDISDVPLGWIALTHKLLPSGTKRKKAHGQLVCIETEDSKIYRAVMFNGSLEGNNLDRKNTTDIVIDWMGWIELHNYAEDVDKPLFLTIRTAKAYELVIAYFMHPDPFYRLQSWITFISSILVGYLLGRLS
jgi:hypothetical protein